MEAARGIYRSGFVLEESSLGPEWSVGIQTGEWPFLSGFATGLGEQDVVTHIYAGDICSVR